MCFDHRPLLGLVSNVDLRCRTTHSDFIISVLLRGLVLALALSNLALHRLAPSGCDRALDVPSGVGLLPDGGIAVSARSRVLVRKSSEVLRVRILRGEVFVRPRRAPSPPLVLTTGSVLLRNIDATVCMEVEGPQTVIAVLNGTVKMSVLGDGVAKTRAMDEMSLRAGDRVELKRVRSHMLFHFSSEDSIGISGCFGAFTRRALEGGRRDAMVGRVK